MPDSAHPQSDALPPAQRPATSGTCTDPIVGAILAGWRYDISSIAPEMRTDYEQHLAECAYCQRRQTISRTIDVLWISLFSLAIVLFLLAAVVIHHIEMLTHIVDMHVHLRQTPITISFEAVAIAGLLISIALWILVAITTPLPGFLSEVLQQHLPRDLRQRFRRHDV